MRSLKPPEALEERRIAGPAGSWSGAFMLRKNLQVIASDGMGWDHVSVSLPTRCPTWEEMCYVKSQFFSDEECVMQLHPPKSKWINNHPYCLHLWRPQTAEEMDAMKREWAEEWDDSWTPSPPIPLPPEICVGLKELGTLNV